MLGRDQSGCLSLRHGERVPRTDFIRPGTNGGRVSSCTLSNSPSFKVETACLETKNRFLDETYLLLTFGPPVSIAYPQPSLQLGSWQVAWFAAAESSFKGGFFVFADRSTKFVKYTVESRFRLWKFISSMQSFECVSELNNVHVL